MNKSFVVLLGLFTCISLLAPQVETDLNLVHENESIHSLDTSDNRKFPKERKDRTVLGSALGVGGIGAIAAGTVGSAKWVPLGFGAGIIGGILLGKGIQYLKNKRKNSDQENKQILGE